MVRERLAKLEQERDEILRLIASLDRRQNIPPSLLSEKNVRTFGLALHERLNAQDCSLRKAYIRELVGRIDVGPKEIRISGSQAALAKGLATAAKRGPEIVPSFVPDWWARELCHGTMTSIPYTVKRL